MADITQLDAQQLADLVTIQSAIGKNPQLSDAVGKAIEKNPEALSNLTSANAEQRQTVIEAINTHGDKLAPYMDSFLQNPSTENINAILAKVESAPSENKNTSSIDSILDKTELQIKADKQPNNTVAAIDLITTSANPQINAVLDQTERQVQQRPADAAATQAAGLESDVKLVQSFGAKMDSVMAKNFPELEPEYDAFKAKQILAAGTNLEGAITEKASMLREHPEIMQGLNQLDRVERLGPHAQRDVQNAMRPFMKDLFAHPEKMDDPDFFASLASNAKVAAEPHMGAGGAGMANFLSNLNLGNMNMDMSAMSGQMGGILQQLMEMVQSIFGGGNAMSMGNMKGQFENLFQSMGAVAQGNILDADTGTVTRFAANDGQVVAQNEMGQPVNRFEANGVDMRTSPTAPIPKVTVEALPPMGG